MVRQHSDLLSSDWSTGFNIELVLDRLKQKEATKRVLFLHSRTFQYPKNMAVSNGKAPSCEEQHVFLRVSRRLEDGTAAVSQQDVKGLSLGVRMTVSSEIRSRPSPWRWSTSWTTSRLPIRRGSNPSLTRQRPPTSPSRCVIESSKLKVWCDLSFFEQAHILLDCGEDNICKPHLKLAVRRCVRHQRARCS